MSELNPEQQAALEKQKEQCIFCKIVSGKVPSKKVYEDDKIIAVLDINPAVKGHVLVMPKEHYPILPLLPKEEFEHLFEKTKELTDAVEQGAVKLGSNIFIANGAAAGQQSQHFMLHIIPRENNDGIDCFRLKKASVDEKEINKLHETLSGNLPLMLRNLYAKYPLDKPVPKLTKEQILNTININPQLKDMILNNPEELKILIPKNPQLSLLFDDYTVEQLADEIRQNNESNELKEPAEESDQEESEEQEKDTRESDQEETEEQDAEVKSEDKPDTDEILEALGHKPKKKKKKIEEDIDLDKITDLL